MDTYIRFYINVGAHLRMCLFHKLNLGVEENIKYRLKRIMVTLTAFQTPKYTRRFLTVKLFRVFTERNSSFHCIILRRNVTV